MKALVILTLFSLLFSDESFEDYVKGSDIKFIEYQKKEAFLWNDFLKSSNVTWVNYDETRTSRSIVDFKKQEITIDIVTKSNDIDKSISKINDKLDLVLSEKLNGEKVVSDVLTDEEERDLKSKIKADNLKKQNDSGFIRYSIKLKLPSDYIIRKAKKYSDIITKYSNHYNLDKSLVYSLTHSESSFNPIAESSVAFGLMQIVPSSAGLDVTKFLYGKEEMVTKDFLLDPENNILFGTTYLYLLETKYLKRIKNNVSRSYCMIAAYNTGPTNLLNSFHKDKEKAFLKANGFSPAYLKNYLLENLPYDETKTYLSRVSHRIPKYNELISLKKL